MKKVELMDVHQYDKAFYTGKINPRILVCMTEAGSMPFVLGDT